MNVSNINDQFETKGELCAAVVSDLLPLTSLAADVQAYDDAFLAMACTDGQDSNRITLNRNFVKDAVKRYK